MSSLSSLLALVPDARVCEVWAIAPVARACPCPLLLWRNTIWPAFAASLSGLCFVSRLPTQLDTARVARWADWAPRLRNSRPLKRLGTPYWEHASGTLWLWPECSGHLPWLRGLCAGPTCASIRRSHCLRLAPSHGLYLSYFHSLRWGPGCPGGPRGPARRKRSTLNVQPFFQPRQGPRLALGLLLAQGWPLPCARGLDRPLHAKRMSTLSGRSSLLIT